MPVSGRAGFTAVLLLVVLASCSLPRPTVGLAIGGTTVTGSREGGFCQTAGCSSQCGDGPAPVAPLTSLRAAAPVRLDFSGGPEINQIHADIWKGETISGQPLETFDLRGTERSYTSQRIGDGRYYLLVSVGWSRITDHGDVSLAFLVEIAPP
jgi:hypothetical protein